MESERLVAIFTPLAIITAIPLGIATRDLATRAVNLIPLALILMMTVSTSQIKLRQLLELRGMLLHVLISISIHLLILTPLIFVVTYAMPNLSDAHRLGFLIMGAAPPAIAVVGYTRILGGDLRLALVSNLVAYLLAFFYTPALISILIGSSLDAAVNIAYALGLYIVVPLFVSRFLTGLKSAERFNGPIIVSMGVIIVYATSGSSLTDPSLSLPTLLQISMIGIARTFMSGLLAYLASLRLGAPFRRGVVYSLFASQKNLGLVAALSIGLGGSPLLLPIAICIPLEAFFFALLLVITSARRRAEESIL